MSRLSQYHSGVSHHSPVSGQLPRKGILVTSSPGPGTPTNYSISSGPQSLPYIGSGNILGQLSPEWKQANILMHSWILLGDHWTPLLIIYFLFLLLEEVYSKLELFFQELYRISFRFILLILE